MSQVAIVVDGVDRTNACLWANCSFELSMNAEVGTFEVRVRDPNRVLSFATGKQISLEIDGVPMFGGYIMQVSMGHAFPADDTSNLSEYSGRQWTLRGVDYNIIFDKRIIRNTADYKHHINMSDIETDGGLLREIIDEYTDMNDFSTSGIQNVATIDGGDTIEQGKTPRYYFNKYMQWGGAVWYVKPDKTIIYTAYENVEKRWGFSDAPNHQPITVSPAAFQGATIGYRSAEATEDASVIVNDALIWGGSEWQGAGGTAFARVQNATSQSTYGRWQYAEVHFGERLYKTDLTVQQRANVIVNGPPGIGPEGEVKGLRFPQWIISFSWFSDDVPLLSGVKDHLRPGDITPIALSMFDTVKLLPLRALRISFPGAFEHANDPDDHLVQFDGMFGLQMTDPFSLWKFLLAQPSPQISVANIVSVGNTDNASDLGSYYQGQPFPLPDGAETTFAIPFPYIPGTIEVYLNGLIQRRDTDYTEAGFEDGEFEMTDPPFAEDNLWIEARTLPS